MNPRSWGAISDGIRHIAGRDVASQLVRIGAQLVAAGVVPGQPVALVASNTLSSALTLLALMQQGQTVVLVPAVDRAEHALPLPRFVSLRLAPRAMLPAGSGTAADDPLPPLADWLELSVPEGRTELAADSPLRQGQLLLRTSGSLGAPKWVRHSLVSLVQNADLARARLALSDADRVLVPVPLAHMYGLGAAFLPALLAGACVELLPGANLLRYLDAERRFQPTLGFLTPGLCATLVRPRASTASYRAVVIAGDRLSPELQTQAEACYGQVNNLYGSTEMGVICATPPGETPAGRVGPPLPGVTLRVQPAAGDERLADPDGPSDGADPGSLDIAAASSADVGELHCLHPCGFVGYVDDDGQPLGGPGADGYATRDLGRLHPDGSVDVLGRLDHATKRDGRLVMLAEVERALCALPAVERAAVLLGPPTLRGPTLLAFVSPRPGAELEASSVLRQCQARLPSFAVPDDLRVLSALPLLPSGKLDRQALQRLLPAP